VVHLLLLFVFIIEKFAAKVRQGVDMPVPWREKSVPKRENLP
jgi:hypothetical protein